MSDLVHLIDIGIGNLGSVENMLRHVGGKVQRVADASDLNGARKLLLPGVGSFDTLASRIDQAGLRQPIRAFAQAGGLVLGICLGMQMLADGSEEGQIEGLGLIPGRVRRFRFEGENASLKVPHMGWNRARPTQEHAIVAGLDETSRFYFVHSYYYDCASQDDVLLQTSYGIPFASGVRRGNVMGFQFHPEKSHRFGMQLFRNFIGL